MIQAPSHLIDVVASLLASDISLSSEQKSFLQEELSTDPENKGYEGKTVPELLNILSSSSVRPNPDPQAKVPLLDKGMDRDKLQAWLLSKIWNGNSLWLGMRAVSKGLVEGVPSQLVQLCDTIVYVIEGSLLKQIDLGNPLVLSMLNSMVQAGLLAESDVEELTTQLDPNYTAYIPVPSPLERLGFSVGTLLTARDLQEVI